MFLCKGCGVSVEGVCVCNGVVLVLVSVERVCVWACRVCVGVPCLRLSSLVCAVWCWCSWCVFVCLLSFVTPGQCGVAHNN